MTIKEVIKPDLSHANQNNHQHNISLMDAKTVILLYHKIINGLFASGKIITSSEHEQILKQIAKDFDLFLKSDKESETFDQIEFANKTYFDHSKELFDDII